MKAIGRLFAFYVHGSIHVAISVVALTAITVLEFELSVPSSLWIFVFLAALTGYNFVKYVPPLAHLHPKLTSLYKTIQGFTVVCFLGLLYVSFQIGWSVLLVAAIFGVFTFFYANPLVKHKNLRGMSGLKIFVVALVWGGVTVLILIIAAGAELNSDVWITFFQRKLLVVVLMIPFELRDMSFDSLNLKTLPQQIGVRNSKFLGEVLLVLILGLEFLKEVGHTAYLASLFIFALFLGGLLLISKTEQKPYFSSFWVESLPIIWLLLFVLLKEI